MDKQRLAKALGWFSLGLGLPQLLAPRPFARFIGVRDDSQNATLVSLVGVREIMAGVGILAGPGTTGWLWARVAGDAMDLTLLSAALTSDNAQKDRVRAAAAAVAGVTVLDILCSRQLSRWPNTETGKAGEDHGMVAKNAISINRSPDELYSYWRNFQNLPRFMTYLESVQVRGDGRSHWKTKAPGGKSVEWDAEVTEDRPNELIAWRSLKGADVPNSGSVRFKAAPGGRGTEVQVEMQYDPPGGAIGSAITKLFGKEPAQQVQGALRAFKQVMETGEIVRSEGNPDGEPMEERPAQPLPDNTGR